jgi:hypothetical protein
MRDIVKQLSENKSPLEEVIDKFRVDGNQWNVEFKAFTTDILHNYLRLNISYNQT